VDRSAKPTPNANAERRTPNQRPSINTAASSWIGGAIHDSKHALMSAVLTPQPRSNLLRSRSDLSIHALEFRGRPYWGVKDPVSLRYYQFREEEYFILRCLDGDTDLESLQERFESEFSPRKIRSTQLLGFISSMHAQGLLITDEQGQAEELLARRDKLVWRNRWEKLAGILSIRFRGVDPDRFLTRVTPHVGWLFSRAVFLAVCCMAILAAALAASQYEVLQQKLPTFYEFFSAKNAVYLAVTLGIVKVLHELGHAIACKRFGGECHEIGFMFLVFTPCLYANVTDSWTMRSKWHRAIISAAGMYVELILSSVCVFLWWLSEPGLLNGLFLNIIFVCSVSTVLFNGNPLLRYDGYYILSHLSEAPNLHQQATAVLKHHFSRWYLGTEHAPSRLLPESGHKWYAAFGIAALAYRFVVLYMIMWFLHYALKPYGLDALVHLVAIMSVGGMLAGPIWQFVSFLKNPSRTREVKRFRLIWMSALTIAIIALVAAFPLPCRVQAPVIVELAGARRVYVSAPGALQKSVSLGASVNAGEELAILENPQYDTAIAKLNERAGELRVKIAHLRKQRLIASPTEVETEPLADIRSLEEDLTGVLADIVKLTTQKEKLIIQSPATGVVLPSRPVQDESEENELPTWSGSPLDANNVGAFLSTGVELCAIGDPNQLEALLLVDQADIRFIALKQRVRVRVHHTPGETVWGEVVEISPANLEQIPPELIASGEAATTTDSQGQKQLLTDAFHVRVRLDEGHRALLLRSVGVAKIHVEPQSLGYRTYRYFAGVFRFDW